MLRLRPFRKNDAKQLLHGQTKRKNSISGQPEFWVNILLLKNACLKQHQAEKITKGIFRLLLLMKMGLSASLLQEYVLKKMIKSSVSDM